MGIGKEEHVLFVCTGFPSNSDTIWQELNRINVFSFVYNHLKIRIESFMLPKDAVG